MGDLNIAPAPHMQYMSNVFILVNRRTSFCLKEGPGTSRWLTLDRAATNNKEVRTSKMTRLNSHTLLCVCLIFLLLSNFLQCTPTFRAASTALQRSSWVTPTAWPLTCGVWAASWPSSTPAILCSRERAKWSR